MQKLATISGYTQLATLLKKETLAQVFSCKFFEISRNNFFTEHLRTTASVHNVHVDVCEHQTP